MSELVKHGESLEEQGRQLYKSNKHYRNIATVMEHPEFRDFYNRYISDNLSVKTMIMFLKIYEEIEKNGQFTPYEKIALVHKVIQDKKMREWITKYMLEWFNDSSSGNTLRKCIEMRTDSKC